MSYGQKKLLSNTDNNFFFELKPVKAWRAIYVMALAIAASLVAGGPIAIVTLPISSLAVGWLFYRRYPLFYCGFVWWMWFVGALIRRFIDLRCGYVTPGPWQLSATLVTSISILTVLKHLPKAYKQGGMPFIVAIAACFYGFLINLVNEGFGAVDQSIFLLFGWGGPIAFGFHIFVHWRDYPKYRQNILRTFLWGVLFMGFYGLIQFLIAPSWDTFFLRSIRTEADVLSFGDPEPFGIRLFSSMDAPQDFAAMMGTGLILLFCVRGSQKLLASGVGYLTFLLTLARSGWLSWLCSTLLLFKTLKSNMKVKMVISISVAILIILPITTIEPFSEIISERVETLGDADRDGSLNSRQEAFNLLIGHALVTYVGYGLQSPIIPNVEISRKYIIGDNGILVILFALGWMGALPYMLSLIHSIFQIQRASGKNNDLLLHASYAIVLGQLSQLFFKSVFFGSFAMTLWGFAGIGMSARNYYLSQNDSQNVF